LKGIIKNIIVIFVYIGYFIVQMGSNFVIQDNTNFIRNQAALQNYHIQENKQTCEFKDSDKTPNYKKANLTKKFYPTSKFEFEKFEPKNPVSYLLVKNTINYQSLKIHKSKITKLEDRGPPALV